MWLAVYFYWTTPVYVGSEHECGRNVYMNYGWESALNRANFIGMIPASQEKPGVPQEGLKTKAGHFGYLLQAFLVPKPKAIVVDEVMLSRGLSHWR